jgi:3-deoxy-D-manno-octulosonic-acid transferase
VYLPLDTRKQVQRFLALTHPKLVVFVKYEFWPNYLKALKNHNAKVILISALLRPDQHFFKFYGKQWQKLFFSFDYIFTQNIESKELLQGIGYTNATVAKDNRFDRVSNQLKENNSLSFINEFVDEKFCVVAGSTWKEDEDILVPYVQNADQKMKFIIVPHSIEEQGIRRLKKYFGGKAVLYSEYKHEELSEKQVFIVDTVGLLSKIYNYADIAYVGGGMGSSGLHNILEPAVFAVPIIIGKNFHKFPEAKELISLGGLISIDSAASFSSALDTFIEDIELRKKSGEKNKAYIEKNTGASSAILKAIGLLLKD